MHYILDPMEFIFESKLAYIDYYFLLLYLLLIRDCYIWSDHLTYEGVYTSKNRTNK